MVKIHFEIDNKESVLPLTDCLCQKVPFPRLTRDIKKVTCRYCLKLIDKGVFGGFENG